MKQIIYKSYSELSAKTASQIAAIINKKPDALICFAAGETSVGTYKELTSLNRSGIVSFKNCRIVGLDEWTGLGKMKNENCLSFMKKHFFDHIDYSGENFCFFNGESNDLTLECKKTDDFIKKNGPVDLMLLGVGMNGHLGLNEPGDAFNQYSHVVELDETTKNVGQKYFSEKTELHQGITLGMKHISEAKTVIIQLSGSKKALITKRLMESEISPDFPASIIKSHANSFLLLDEEAAENL
jgi:glucosamine-6-phosphate isomerase